MKESRDIIISLLRTEKGTEMKPLDKYFFWINKKANKIEVKRAVEDIYKVKVAKVNTLVVSGKKRRVRYKEGHTPDWKKAIVTLRKGEKIEME